MSKKYTVSYVAGSTGYGWEHEYDLLDAFEGFIDECRKEKSAHIRVWDEDLGAFIFWKDCLEMKPRIDMLHDFRRDMRTITRRMK